LLGSEGLFQIASLAENITGTGDDDNVDIFVLIYLLAGVFYLLPKLTYDDVTFGRTIQDYLCNMFAFLKNNRRIRHGCLLIIT
jgi:hypothetical protein